MNISKGSSRQNVRNKFIGMVCIPRRTVGSTLWLVICDNCTGHSAGNTLSVSNHCEKRNGLNCLAALISMPK